MGGVLTQEQWKALTHLYAAGTSGLPYDGSSYGEAWPALQFLRDHVPPLGREIVRLDPHNHTTHYLVIITEAGEKFYEKNRRFYNALYAP